MIPRATRTLRASMLGLLFIVVVAVAWSLRKPGRPDPASLPQAAPGSGTRSEGLVLRSFREGEQRFVIKAQSSLGQEKEGLQLRGVEVTFPYRSRDKSKTEAATITADECLCEPEPRRAAFKGHVRVTTEDGLLLETEALDYRGDTGLAESALEVRFKRGKVSGSSTGVRYEAEAQRLEMLSDVRIRIEEEGKPPTDVQAGHGVAQRSDNTMDFSGGVAVKKGAEWLEAAELNLGFLGDFEVVTRALAKDDVRVQTSDAQILPGAKGPPISKGGRRLSCRKLDVVFRPDKTLQQAVASGGHDDAGTQLYADLELLPGLAGPTERRRLRARVIVFRFDDQGRLETLEGQLGTILTSEPRLPRGAPPTRTAQSEGLIALLDAASGTLKQVDFDGRVDFVQAKQRASGQKARYDAVTETLFLTGDARLLDEGQGSDLRAEAIDVGTRKEVVAARGNVRHTVTRPRSTSRPGLLSREEPAVFLSRLFDYDGTVRTARYRENALLRSGKDEVRAPLLVLEEAAVGQRRLTGSGGVASILYPRPQPAATKPPEPVETRSEELLYDEAKNRVTYKGEVAIRQGDIRTKSPEAVVTLSADGSAIESVVAGEPVEVVQGARKATGTRGTYTPGNETFVLVGEKVQLQDADRHVEGRILTFQVGDDRIRVDGQEEARTEAVFKREPSTPAPQKADPTKGTATKPEPGRPKPPKNDAPK
jgi:LPS export ABC transporter protein LptC/lipopolysaccharide transport protein LptA